MHDNFSRRDFLAFLGRTTIGAELALTVADAAFAVAEPTTAFTPIGPGQKDELVMAEGFQYHSILKWGDRLNEKGDEFGANNDYLAFLPLNPSQPTDGLLWTNHEAPTPLSLISGFEKGGTRTEAQIAVEQRAVGGSIARIRKSREGRWELVQNDPLNRRISALTEIPFAWHEPIADAKIGVGTLGNCAGGVTPWGTVLTCEENYQDYYGEVGRDGKLLPAESQYGWERFQKRDPRHYGWVVEINPRTGEAKKLIALGRFSHESATVVAAKDGRLAVYMGDDAEDRCLYKFVSAKPGNLETGTLYAADTKNGRWLPLDREKNAKLKKEFATQTELLIHTRLAAELAGATPLHRPEDVAVDPITGAVYLALTNSAKHDDPYGSLVKLLERKKDPLALDFEFSTFAAGGKTTGFASPDNLEFDRKGNLWMTSDISGKVLNQGAYASFANNSLFYIPTQGKLAGKAHRVANAPVEAEFTGPCFAPDGETLFLSVQHPGELSPSKEKPTSRWPDGPGTMPRSAVVAVSGKTLKTLV